MIVTHFFSDSVIELNSSVWRGLIPSRALQKAGHIVHTLTVHNWLYHQSTAVRACSQSDLIIVQRVMVEDGLREIDFWRSLGKAMVVDIDDSYALLQAEKVSGNQAAQFWHEGIVEMTHPMGVKFSTRLAQHPLEQFIFGCRRVTGLTMPSRILAEDWSWAARCWVIPNFIDADRYLFHRKENPFRPETLTIGWGGSLSHLLSFKRSGVLEALQRIFRSKKDLRLLICGDQRIYDLIPIQEGRKVFQPYVTWVEWPRILAQFDIQIAPLAGRYDDSRSAIKLTEGSIMGIPTLASGSPAYQDYQDNDVGVYTSDSADDEEGYEKRVDEWEKLLGGMIDHWSDYKERIVNQLDYALTWSVDQNIGFLEKTYREISDAHHP